MLAEDFPVTKLRALCILAEVRPLGERRLSGCDSLDEKVLLIGREDLIVIVGLLQGAALQRLVHERNAKGQGVLNAQVFLFHQDAGRPAAEGQIVDDDAELAVSFVAPVDVK